MSDLVTHPLYQLQEDEKTASVMVYTNSMLCIGDVIVKNAIRVSTWLRTNAAPDSVCLYDAKAVFTGSGGPLKPMTFPEIHINLGQIMAFHLLPPARDPLDYDISEPNRRMQPVTVLVGSFRFNGGLRLAALTSLAKYLEVARETYTALYDVDISNPAVAELGVVKVPYALVRFTGSLFAVR